MNDLKVSLVVAVYKDVAALSLIIESLKTQTYKNFELLVAEDGESEVMQKFLKTQNDTFFELIHTTQIDIGIRKSMSQNNAIRASSGEYLIFIDGDCLLYSTFIESHIALSQENYFVGGKRVNLGPKYSKMLRNHEISAYELEQKFFLKFFDINKDAIENHTEEGFNVSVDSWVYKFFLKDRKKQLALVGCNFACFKKDMLKINGFNEELEDAAVASDTDIQWRFEAIGLHVKSAKYIANQFHLYHKRSEDQARGNTTLYLENRERNNYIAKAGIYKI